MHCHALNSDFTGPNGRDVVEWPQTANSGPTGKGQAISGVPLPRLDTTSESHPFVRIEMGGFFDFGPMRMDLGSQGFTAVACVRFRQVGNWSRLLDIGSGSGPDNVLVGQLGNTRDWILHHQGAGNHTATPVIATNQWQVIAARLSPQQSKKTLITDAARTDATWSSPKEVYEFGRAYVAKSWWASDSYAAIDIREIQTFNRALSDADFLNAHNTMRSVYGLV